MIGDATCCLLTCEGMIAHHLITSIYTRVAREAKKNFFLQSTTHGSFCNTFGCMDAFAMTCEGMIAHNLITSQHPQCVT